VPRSHWYNVHGGWAAFSHNPIEEGCWAEQAATRLPVPVCRVALVAVVIRQHKSAHLVATPSCVDDQCPEDPLLWCAAGSVHSQSAGSHRHRWTLWSQGGHWGLGQLMFCTGFQASGFRHGFRQMRLGPCLLATPSVLCSITPLHYAWAGLLFSYNHTASAPHWQDHQLLLQKSPLFLSGSSTPHSCL
jgi:hypothetical protein